MTNHPTPQGTVTGTGASGPEVSHCEPQTDTSYTGQIAKLRAELASYRERAEAREREQYRLIQEITAECDSVRARAEAAEKALDQAHDTLSNPDAKMHEQITVALGIVGNALAALAANAVSAKAEKS